jgi:hypothetical protein
VMSASTSPLAALPNTDVVCAAGWRSYAPQRAVLAVRTVFNNSRHVRHDPVVIRETVGRYTLIRRGAVASPLA